METSPLYAGLSGPSSSFRFPSPSVDKRRGEAPDEL